MRRAAVGAKIQARRVLSPFGLGASAVSCSVRDCPAKPFATVDEVGAHGGPRAIAVAARDGFKHVVVLAVDSAQISPGIQSRAR